MVKKKVHHDEEADEKWLLPYSDMLTLLLALFIVMFAMSEIDKAKFQEFNQKFGVIFSGGSGLLENGGNSVAPNTSVVSDSSAEETNMNKIKKTMDKEIGNSGYKDNVKVVLNDEGLQISIQDLVLFNSGDAEVLKEVTPLLLKICKTLYGLDNNIKIVGHTDNVPVHNEKFRSNWDLSAIRAINVMNFMVDSGGISPDKVSIEAYGEYMPKYDNSTAEGRAKNRRVEIYIVRKYPITKDNNQTNNKK
ncbi:MAG: OmpA family protein [Bacillota bacterium]|nr:OmpA family protein [Bacillota bacterium]